MTPPERTKDLQERLKNKSLTMSNFIKECVLWQFEPECVGDLDVLQYPPAPEEWIRYEQMDQKEKDRIDPSFFREKSISWYLQQKDHVYSHNTGLYGWLREMKADIPDVAENLTLHRAMDEKIYAFKRWMNLLPKHKIEGYEYKPQRDHTEPERVADIFGGSVV